MLRVVVLVWQGAVVDRGIRCAFSWKAQVSFSLTIGKCVRPSTLSTTRASVTPHLPRMRRRPSTYRLQLQDVHPLDRAIEGPPSGRKAIPSSVFDLHLFLEKRDLGAESIELSRLPVTRGPTASSSPCRGHCRRGERHRMNHSGADELGPSAGQWD